jgi:hypothetical protein
MRERMSAVLKEIPTEVLEAEVTRRREAERKAKWARGKAEECLTNARSIEAKPSHGRTGREMSKARAANYARAEARDWEAKAKRYEEEAGITPAADPLPF